MEMVAASLVGVLACWAASTEGPVEEQDVGLFPAAEDLMEGVPADFPRFHFEGHEEQAQLLSRFLWYHFRMRPGNSPVLFNKEYLTTADMWMGGAVRPDWPKSAQETLRQNLLAIELNPDGYVHTNQHFGHAHEQGWPFPTWYNGRAGADGLTAGWHFQDDGPGWVWEHYLRHHPDSPYRGEKAVQSFGLEDLKSQGIVDGKWRLRATGPATALLTPTTVRIDPSNAPFLQLRWKRSGEPPEGALPYVEWMREEDDGFGPECRMHFGFDTGNPGYEGISGMTHSLIPVHEHPLWKGSIKQIRICLAPGESDVAFDIDSFFTVYDTRHTINNPIYILSCWEYFRWTGDVTFLKAVVNRMRTALRYQQTVMGGFEHNHIRNEWVGHDGLPGYDVNADGSKTMHHGRGIGSNYWDLLPFGWDDLYATGQYYASTLVMAEAEEAILANPEWEIPSGAPALDPAALRKHAADVKRASNKKFWNRETKRFYGVIDKHGDAHDYGLTFLNLDAIWYGVASDRHAKAIMEWLDGGRIVEGDTSTGEDIYHWRFGPRATTKRNVDWYAFVWTGPESIPWGGQVQDGGAVLGFTFYDLWARLHVLGPDNAWERLCGIFEWEQDVWTGSREEGASPYRAYYEGGERGTTLQGGGTAGGLGIDAEFFETSLVPSIIVHGFLGLNPNGAELRICPQLPKGCPEMGVSNLLYHGTRIDVKAGGGEVAVAVKSSLVEPLRIRFANVRRRQDTGEQGVVFVLADKGVYCFEGP